MPEVRVGCRVCGTCAVFDGVVGRGARCERCGADLRCCDNCRFHDESAYNECGEPAAERVIDKDRANFCDYFSPTSVSARSRASHSASSSPEGAAAPDVPVADSLESLFRKH